MLSLIVALFPPRRHLASRSAAVVMVITMVGVALTIGWSLRARSVPGAGSEQLDVWLDGLLSILPLGVAGAVLIDRRPDLPFGWLLALAAIAQVITVALTAPAMVAIQEGSQAALPRWGLVINLWFLPEMVKGQVNLRFPSGRLQSRRARVLEVAIIGSTVLGFLGGLFGSMNLTRDAESGAAPVLPAGLEHPLTAGTTVGTIADALIVFVPLTVLLGLVAGLGVLVRWRRAQGVERQQLTWRAVGVVIGIVFFPIAVTGGADYLTRLDVPFFVVTLVVPVLRYRLWSIDTVVRRSVAYAGVIAVLVGVYAAVVAAVAALISERVGAMVAAVAIALAFVPLRDRARRLVDRLFYGDRTDPYRALSALGRRLERVRPTEVAPTLVETVAQSLRLPYAAIERPDHSLMAAYGVAGTSVEHWPLTFEDITVGFLAASPRSGEETFDGRDRDLLTDVARHAGAAVHAAALTNDLLVSRQRLITAREEERRRLRRDLHDGLGPVLTAVGLNIDAARAQLGPAPATADDLLERAREATTQAIDDLRRVVYGLRPPALDDLGLLGALRAQIDRLAPTSDLRVHLDVGDVPSLPAAVEVAVYRTAVEGLHNAVRHGGARHCEVRLHKVGRDLVLEVCDDGTSAGPWVPGVGLTAMRERAEDLGGTFTGGPRVPGGGSITSRFPLLEVAS
jgi:signal transduction histidine kinase